MDKNPQEKGPVLVAIMNDLMDFEIAKRYHWYRIPVDSPLKEVEKYKYIAFYQTKIFREEKWAVNYIAKIHGIERVKRIELLPEEKDNPKANNLYYKIRIGTLIRLKNPIPSRALRRIVFIPTTMEKIKTAKEINDLYNNSPLEDRLWENLKKNNIYADRQFYFNRKYCLDFAIKCNEGSIDIECDGKKWHSGEEKIENDRDRNNRLTSKGWHILRFGTKDINENMDKCMDIIKETIRTLAGEKIEKTENEKI